MPVSPNLTSMCTELLFLFIGFSFKAWHAAALGSFLFLVKGLCLWCSVCLCLCVHVRLHSHMQRPEEGVRCPALLVLSYSLETVSSKPQQSSCLHSQEGFGHRCACSHSHLYGCWDPNSSPHACKVSALTHKPCFQSVRVSPF